MLNTNMIKKTNYPDYIKIYTYLIRTKFPDKWELCSKILNKEKMSSLDVIVINKILFGKNQNEGISHHHVYDRESIDLILKYQKEKKLNNTQLAKHFQMSRNTIIQWKKFNL